MTAKQLKNGNISVYAAIKAAAKSLEERSEVWVKAPEAEPGFRICQASRFDREDSNRKCNSSLGSEDNICGMADKKRSEEDDILAGC